ncbi:MAG TPA: hypothetical protein PKM25_07380 [Candidatus Ozemobacteraceae bacterium]|nr:hypothetical protein [Candidatus Ozemobacteraceae bacterium]
MSKPKPPAPPVPPEDDVYKRLNVFRPVCERSSPQKHPCPDCFSCQFCSDARCAICLAGQGKRCCRKGATDTNQPAENGGTGQEKPVQPKKEE